MFSNFLIHFLLVLVSNSEQRRIRLRSLLPLLLEHDQFVGQGRGADALRFLKNTLPCSDEYAEG